METLKPWTVIFPLNELYYLAQKEREIGYTLPIIGLKVRKEQRFEHPQTLPHKPWEKYTQTIINILTISYNADIHEGFTLQDQAKRNKKRGLKATFIDELILKQEKESKESYYRLKFKITRVPKKSKTLKNIQNEIKAFKRKYGLYQEISKKDKSFYGRIFRSPSCLELSEVKPYHPRFNIKNDHLVDGKIQRSNPIDLLNGLTKKSQEFMAQVMLLTKHMAWDVYKQFSEKSEFILDEMVSPEMIKKRFNFEENQLFMKIHQ